MQIYFENVNNVKKISHKMESIMKALLFRGRCVIISTARKKFENAFSGKDELMGNLKTAALACGVVASVLGGSFGVGYLTSSTVRTADLVSEENTVEINANVITSANADSNSADKATTYNRTTTKKSYTAGNTTAVSSKTKSVQEGTTSMSKTEAATKAAQISRSVPAPAHAPAAITQPASQPATTADIETSIAATSAAPAVTAVTTVYEAVTTLIETTTTTSTAAATTAVTTTAVATPAAPVTTLVTEAVAKEEVVVTDVEVNQGSLPITDEEYIILCNAVANEAGCSWINEYDKAKVVEVIMNRVNSPKYPNTIYGVLTQPYQFTGAYRYVDLGTYSVYVTQSVKDAVTLYFNEPESFTQGYCFFYGDGVRNYFY